MPVPRSPKPSVGTPIVSGDGAAALRTGRPRPWLDGLPQHAESRCPCEMSERRRRRSARGLQAAIASDGGSACRPSAEACINSRSACRSPRHQVLRFACAWQRSSRLAPRHTDPRSTSARCRSPSLRRGECLLVARLDRGSPGLDSVAIDSHIRPSTGRRSMPSLRRACAELGLAPTWPLRAASLNQRAPEHSGRRPRRPDTSCERILRVGVAEIGRRIGEKDGARGPGRRRPGRVCRLIIVAERHEGVGDERRVRAVAVLVAISLATCRRRSHRLAVVLGDEVAGLVHAAELPELRRDGRARRRSSAPRARSRRRPPCRPRSRSGRLRWPRRKVGGRAALRPRRRQDQTSRQRANMQALEIRIGHRFGGHRRDGSPRRPSPDPTCCAYFHS